MNVEWLIKHVETRTKYTKSKQSQNKVRNNPDKVKIKSEITQTKHVVLDDN